MSDTPASLQQPLHSVALSLPPAAPVLAYYAPTAAAVIGIWNDHGRLLMHRQAKLPARCIQCNQPPHGPPIRLTVTWYSPWLYFLLLLTLPGLIALMAFMIFGQWKETLNLCFCKRHRRQRAFHLATVWGLVGISFLAFLISPYVSNDDFQPILIVTAITLLFIAPMYGFFTCRVLRPTKMNAEYIWLKGAAPDLVAEFPPIMSPLTAERLQPGLKVVAKSSSGVL